MTIAVPVGKRIKISDRNWRQVNIKVNRASIQTETLNGIGDGWYDEWNEPWDNESYAFEKGVEYRMTATGLEKLKRAENYSDHDNEDENPDAIQQRLNKIKEERLELEQQLNKNKPAETKEVEKKNITMQAPAKTNHISSLVTRFADLHWVLDKFSY